MSRFFFDINDGRHREFDRSGQELSGIEAARDTAIQELALIIRDEMPKGNRESYVVTVRDERGTPVIVATAVMVCEALGPPDA